jgi:phage terminase small subunit
MADEIKPLTEKEELFCQSYLIDFNGARAAREAGYSSDSAKEIACENLTKPHIRARIQELRTEMGKSFNITRERIAQEYSRMAFGDIRKIFKADGSLLLPHEWDDDTAAIIAGLDTDELFEGAGQDREQIGYTKKVKLNDKRAALDSLVKMMGYAAPTKTELTGADGNELNFKVSLDLGSKPNHSDILQGQQPE